MGSRITNPFCKFIRDCKSRMAIGKMAKTLTFILVIFINQTFGQVIQPDPYKLELTELNIPATKNEVTKSHIKKIRSLNCRKRKKPKYKGQLVSLIEFNQTGLPQYCLYLDQDIDFWPRLLSELNISKASIDSFVYNFSYDSLQRLCHVQEKITHSIYYENSEADIFNYYNSKNELWKQIVINKKLYTRPFLSTGEIMHNDTTSHTIFLFYDSSYSKNNSPYLFHKIDSVIFNCPYDSIFIDKNPDDENELMTFDSLGRVLTIEYPGMQGHLVGGGHMYGELPNDEIDHYFYHPNGKVSIIETKTRSGKLIQRKLFQYNNLGLLTSEQVEKSRRITYYIYEYF